MSKTHLVYIAIKGIFPSMFVGTLWLMLVFVTCNFTRVSSQQEPKQCYNRFEYEYNVLEKIIILTEKVETQEKYIKELTEQLADAKTTIRQLNQSLITKELSTDGVSYVRWGRTTCPDGATVVYKGHVAGAHHTHSGAGSSRLCLPTEPKWGSYVDGYNSADRLYGAEYETSYFPKFKHLQDNDVPCVVCRIPRSNVLMIPGRNECYEDYVIEYHGFLMAEHYTHASSPEYVCVDSAPETIEGGGTSTNGALFYPVESSCDGLRCPPYVAGREITCAVCSYSPKTKN